MIGAIVSWLVARGIKEKAAAPLAWVLLALAIAALAYGGARVWLAGHDSGVIADHEAGVQLDIERAGRAADQHAEERRRERSESEEQAREEFDDATADIPDEGLTIRQRIDVCGELRDAGTDTSVIPECGDVSAGAEAGAVDREDPARRLGRGAATASTR